MVSNQFRFVTIKYQRKLLIYNRKRYLRRGISVVKVYVSKIGSSTPYVTNNALKISALYKVA